MVVESSYSSGRVYVGNLPRGTTSGDIKNIFELAGRVRHVSHIFGYHFAFVEFEDHKKITDAVSMDGYYYMGNYLKVQFIRGSRSRGVRRWRPSDQKGGIPDFCRQRHCVLVTGLPIKTTWRDLKNFLRRAGHVLFANVYKDGSGFAEFETRRHVRRAAKRLNLKRFINRKKKHAYIRVFKAVKGSRRRASRERTRSRSKSCSPLASASRQGGAQSRSPRPPSSTSCRCALPPQFQTTENYRIAFRPPPIAYNRRSQGSPSPDSDRRDEDAKF